mmetsp:Transcript_16871/g.47356  ORF Transcript_16871/g.47356 Transcript_16871/m.47356 type:complete len:522 (+) Transcript_16871:354-1919(+)
MTTTITIRIRIRILRLPTTTATTTLLLLLIITIIRITLSNRRRITATIRRIRRRLQGDAASRLRSRITTHILILITVAANIRAILRRRITAAIIRRRRRIIVRTLSRTTHLLMRHRLRTTSRSPITSSRHLPRITTEAHRRALVAIIRMRLTECQHHRLSRNLRHILTRRRLRAVPAAATTGNIRRRGTAPNPTLLLLVIRTMTIIKSRRRRTVNMDMDMDICLHVTTIITTIAITIRSPRVVGHCLRIVNCVSRSRIIDRPVARRAQDGIISRRTRTTIGRKTLRGPRDRRATATRKSTAPLTSSARPLGQAPARPDTTGPRARRILQTAWPFQISAAKAPPRARRWCQNSRSFPSPAPGRSARMCVRAHLPWARTAAVPMRLPHRARPRGTASPAVTRSMLRKPSSTDTPESATSMNARSLRRKTRRRPGRPTMVIPTCRPPPARTMSRLSSCLQGPSWHRRIRNALPATPIGKWRQILLPPLLGILLARRLPRRVVRWLAVPLMTIFKLTIIMVAMVL